jgi:predicted ester cyclase
MHCVAPSERQLSHEEAAMSDNKEVLQRYYQQVFNSRELDAIGDYWADQKLRDMVTRGCMSYFDSFPDLHVSVDEMIAEDDRVFVRSTMTGTHDGGYKGIAPTGRNVATDCAEVYRFADGKIVGYWCLTNVAGLVRQLTEEQAPVAV